ncbi:phenylacetic acid degradation protein PaaY [Burkholderia dolosa]|uniref:gamma carbonic anhydrase family protein n=1 Tax=Burkholderia dolosa TaxID=152500 RepID=UPI001B93F157|nr:DapH/DapD/GlmU-related protein [Burkholderia dolosa]MBR8299312.1 phenylacetic acid degradation protein PaaY [Burkholderia dolosa]
MALYEFLEKRPRIDATAFVHEMAAVIGDVHIGPGCYIGPFASLRGDFGRIEIGAGSNVQESCVLHVAPREVCRLEPNSHIGHGAIVHGAHIGRDVLIGMNSVIMDGVVIGDTTIVGAGAMVTAGRKIPPGVLVIGSPARVARSLDPDEIAAKRAGTEIYQDLARDCLTSLRRIDRARPE